MTWICPTFRFPACHSFAAIIHFRIVSRLTSIPSRRRNSSLANVGPNPRYSSPAKIRIALPWISPSIRRFEGSKVKIVALSINDSSECAFVRFLLSHPEQGREILERAGLALIESDLIGVELPDLDHMIVVALARTRAPVRLHVDVGSRFPALISATGRCLAAFSSQPWSEIEKRFRRLRWHKPPAYAAWRGEVYLARRQGFSIDRGNYIAGVTIVAVAVLDSRGTISHTLAAVGLGNQLDRATSFSLARDMQQAAREVTAELVPQA